jgi:hypothetical protein
VIAALLHAIGITPRVPYSMQPTPPLGVAQLWSLAFWGGVWGVALAAALRRCRRSARDRGDDLRRDPALARGVDRGRRLKGQPLFAGGAPKGLAVGLLVNAAWGFGTGTGLALFGRPAG